MKTKCRYYKALDKQAKTNCLNCEYWLGKNCRDGVPIAERCEEHTAFDMFDRMMKDNRGVYLE